MERPSLLGFIALQTLSAISKKKLFGGQYFLFGEFLERSQLGFQECGVLGYLYRDKIEDFANLFTMDGTLPNFTEYLSKIGEEQFAQYKPEQSGWSDFFCKTYGPRIMQRFYDSKFIPSPEWNNFIEAYKSKIPQENGLGVLVELYLYGVALGYKHPELVEKFFAFVVDAQEWRKMYNSGLSISPDPPTLTSLVEMQSEAKNLIKPFVRVYFPELMQALDLNSF